MADTNLTITQLEDTFYTITSQILGTLDESRVRIGWPREGAPAWKIDEDVAFILVAFDDDPYTRQTETTYPTLDQFNANQSVAYTRVVRVSWTFYGPSSFEDADKVRVEFLRQNFKDTLKAKNLFLITDTPMPSRMPELFNGRWWNRTSLYMRFNEKVDRRLTVPYLQSANVNVIGGAL